MFNAIQGTLGRPEPIGAGKVFKVTITNEEGDHEFKFFANDAGYFNPLVGQEREFQFKPGKPWTDRSGQTHEADMVLVNPNSRPPRGPMSRPAGKPTTFQTAPNDGFTQADRKIVRAIYNHIVEGQPIDPGL